MPSAGEIPRSVFRGTAIGERASATPRPRHDLGYPQEPHMSDPCAEFSAPSKRNAILQPLVGVFTSRTLMHMFPGKPAAESAGRMVNSWALGGRFLESRYRSTGPMGEFEGLGYCGFDRSDEKLHAVWMDNFSMMMLISSGDASADGRVLQSSGSFTIPGMGAVVARNVTTIRDEDHHRYEIFHAMGGSERLVLEVEYTRERP